MHLYDDHAESRDLLRSFMALALLPMDRIQEGFELVKQNVLASPHSQELGLFVAYFEKEWFQSFTPSDWSVNKKTWRTNNFAEGK